MSINEQEGAEIRLLPEETNTDAEFRWVDPDALPSNAAIGPPPPTRDLIESVRVFGVRQPVALLEIEPTDEFPWSYAIVGGRRRTQAAREVGLPSIPAMVGRDPEGMAVLDVQLNSTAKPNEFAYIDRIASMRHDGADLKQIGAATGMPIGTIKRLMNVHDNLDPTLMRVARDGRMRFTTAEAAAKLTPDQQHSLVEGPLEEKGKITGPDVSEAKRAYHERFQEVDLGLDDMPDFEESRREVEQGQDALRGAQEHLRARLSEVQGKASSRWTKEDQAALRTLLGM